jgi:hypothetical protein
MKITMTVGPAITRPKAKRHVIRSDGMQPTRYFIGGGRITAEDVAWLYEKLTGRQCTSEELEALRKKLEDAYAKHEGKSQEPPSSD